MDTSVPNRFLIGIDIMRFVYMAFTKVERVYISLAMILDYIANKRQCIFKPEPKIFLSKDRIKKTFVIVASLLKN